MAFSNIDRTTEVNTSFSVVLVNPTDHCHNFEKHADTLLWRKECWTCKYSNFGIETGTPTDRGICRYKRVAK
jgi:hypothetical protein